MGISRREMYSTLGVVSDGPNLEAVTEQAYKYVEQHERKVIAKAPEGRNSWHTSFHGSMFPGGVDDRRCGRQALYTLMDVPDDREMPRLAKTCGAVGTAIERHLLWTWMHLDIVLNDDGGYFKPSKHWLDWMPQVGIEDPDTWLTGSIDAILDIRPRWKYALPVDVKSEFIDNVEQMKVGAKSYKEDHYKQLQAYMYLVNLAWDDLKYGEMGLERPIGGIIYYIARDRPTVTWQAWIPYDEAFVEAGLERLRAWKDDFINDRLPERPKEWQWSKPPCQWCPFKKSCREDVRNDVERLSESHALQFAAKVRDGYDPAKVRQEVLDRWMKD